MPKSSRFAHCGRAVSALSLVCVLSCARSAFAQNNDPLNPPITMYMKNVPFAVALDTLCRSAPISFRLPADLASRIDPDAKISMDMNNGTVQDALTAVLSQANPPMAFHLVNGVYVVEFTGTPGRPRPATKPMPHPFDIKGRPFEEVARFMFNAEHTRYRIDPAVTAYRDPVTFNADDTTLDTKLGLLLASVPGQKSPLTYRVEKGVYIIAPRNAAAKPSEANTPIGLPSYNPTPAIKSVAIRDEHPGAALEQMFTQAGVNYAFALPSGVGATPRLTFAMRDVPLEQAVVHLLRSAPVQPTLRLEVLAGAEGALGPEDAQSLQASQTVYRVIPDPLAVTSGPLPAMHFWFGFHKTDVYNTLKTLLAGAKINYAMDPALRAVSTTASGSDLPLEQAVSRLLAGSSQPLTSKIENGMLTVALTEAASGKSRP